MEIESSKSLPQIDVIIPAFNEEKSIGKVIKDIPKDWVREIIVVNNRSSDRTEEVAREAGATVLSEERPGYGYACLKGIDYLKGKSQKDQPDILVFLDGDYSDFPEELPKLAQPIVEGNAQMVIGSRALGKREKGALTPQQVFGNWLATRMLKLIYGATFSDLGPFRAIRFQDLLAIGMKDRTYGWTVEMQVKAAKNGLVSMEVPVNYRKRIGVSKVSGTVKGTIMAGYKIIWTIIKYM